MSETDRTLATYLHLARASHLRLQPMVRDKLLVLAGVEAESIGLASISALCRHKILAHNPRHLLGNWPTLAAALVDERFQTYLKQLKRRYSPEKAEHMLDSLGIELGRERQLYASDLEYAAALLDTEPEAIAGLLALAPNQLASDRWPAGEDVVGSPPPVARGRSPDRMRKALVVWAPFVMGLAALAVSIALFRALER
jgi:hypothetical protein